MHHEPLSWGRPADIPIGPRVPTFDQWHELGIAGEMGTGYLAGRFVLAERFGIGNTYVLHLPEENVYSDTGTHVMDDGVTGEMTPGTGGLIDVLTSDLNITWSFDPEIVARVSMTYQPENGSSTGAGD